MNTALSTLNDAEEESRDVRGKGGREVSLCSFRISGRATHLPTGSSNGRPKFSSWKVPNLTVSFLLVMVILYVGFAPNASADWFDDSPPAWEPLLLGGKIPGLKQDQTALDDTISENRQHRGTERSQPSGNTAHSIDLATMLLITGPTNFSLPNGCAIPEPSVVAAHDYYRAPFRVLSLKNIPPLYSSPVLPGEGVWKWRNLPTDENGWPVVYMTTYRPSVEYPNAIVHMLLFDMKRLSIKLYIGSGEPGASPGSSMITPDSNHRLIAVTNALWKQRHSGNAGTVFRGTVLKKLVPGVATLVVYKDSSVDILEWNDSIPLSLVRDAKQLRHLIVKDGRVVTSIVKNGRVLDAEIGLGYLLTEDKPSYGGGMWGGYWSSPQPTHTSGSEWFIATRSAFGIRNDGNLVFAVGHHISTKDLAKALVLAGCQRAIHGDANPYNVLGNLYYSDGNGGFVKKAKLSPEQSSDSINRYVGRSYSSDFFGFFLKAGGKDSPSNGGTFTERHPPTEEGGST